MFITNITRRKVIKVFITNAIIALVLFFILYILKIDCMYKYLMFIFIYLFMSSIINYYLNKHDNIKHEKELFFYGGGKIPNQNFLKFFPKNEYKEPAILISVDIANHKEIINAFNEEFYNEILNNVFDNIKEEIKNKNLIVSNSLRKITIVGKNTNEKQILECIKSIFNKKRIINNIPVGLNSYIGYEVIGSISDLHSDTLFTNANIASTYALTHDINLVNFTDIENVYSFDYTLLKYFPEALEQNDVFFLYQPIISKTPKKYFCVEMLVRWNRQDKIIMPNDFIPSLEKTELIHDLSLYAIKQASRNIKIFNKKGMNITMTINISPKNINNDKFVDKALSYIQSTGLDPEQFEFEITEGTLMNFNERNVNNLNKIRGAGVKVTIDDFGVGYSSMAYLKEMVIDYIKIDKALLKNVLVDPKQEKMYRNLITLIKDLEYDLVVEGVETEGQLKYLKTLDVDYYQGYLISKPITFDDLVSFLDKEYKKHTI